MIRTNKIKQVKIIFISLLALAIAMSFTLSNNKTEGASSVAAGHKAEESGEQQQAQQPKKPAKVSPSSAGCVVCHTGTESMHFDGDEELGIGCVDCHGGDSRETQNKKKAHINARFLKEEDTNNPVRIAAAWNKESDEYIRFVNPGDIRAADISCGKCHEREVMWMKKNMMTHGGMLWGAALYNNGAYQIGRAHV